ncbi:uncharacterized protein LOC121873318 [Homarus americanus]|uniref:uncharacterized protein LOC121873318 n=1 Tax=Homarus americanus TaxID=6706 RepID=UPI001C46AA94|nr:uncharacterized protein LOC121873318 [Homarus americanus]XP_042232761.1 uncharacterized protein LOC121873318 [Homarus americanus]
MCRVAALVVVLWAAVLHNGHGLLHLTHSKQAPGWTFLPNPSSVKEEKQLLEGRETQLAASDVPHYHTYPQQPWPYREWVGELQGLEQQQQKEVPQGDFLMAPLTYQAHKRGTVGGPVGGDSTDRSDEKDTIDGSWSWEARRRAAKRGIGLFSLAFALAQKPTNAPKPRRHPIDISAYPRRARFFVASMG